MLGKHISLLENGGKVLVVGGMNKAWQTYRNNPRVEFWTGEQNEIARTVRNRSIPQNCKAVIISRFISHTELGLILQDVRQRRLVLFANKNDGEITELLDDLTRDLRERELLSTPPPITTEPTTTPKTEETTMAKRGGDMSKQKGKLTPLLQYVNWDKTNAENARALLANAVKDLGIDTTFGSISQFLMQTRKKMGLKTVGRSPSNKGKSRKPKDLSPKKVHVLGPELDVAVATLDEVMSNLTDLREYLVKVTNENNELREQNSKMKPLLDAIKALK